ncbi:PQQ-dependent sugar dehydrogenase [Alteribacillus sp. JSM 102045]|uniref:PQQ-dependent sugar dehydrogenase n=1 Tax=Alteribacillus sp. JSM 102045 TaxID=1562101 RepID=UPI0035BF6F6E
MLRLELDCSIPEDNPIEDSYVILTAQGLIWDDNENLYSSEHGPSGLDEKNAIEPGQRSFFH